MKTRIFEQAKTLGFSAVGVAAPALPERARARMAEFIAEGQHGDMAWMQEKAHLRADPKAFWPEVKSILMLGHNYGPAHDPMKQLQHKNHGVISAYAQNRDYHDVMKKRMKQLARWMVEEFSCEVKIFVDTAPIMEKPLAEAAGLGWGGKHTCIVSRDFGSWLFLGEIFTTLALEPDAPAENRCGSCTRCMDVCPTQAFSSCGHLDARRCIAYLTIEHKGQIPVEYRKPMGNRIYGCDDCLAVCPWNKFAQTAQEAAYHARETLKMPRLSDLVQLDDAQFREMFSGSPVKRLGRDRFVRNVLVAIGNSGDASHLSVIAPLKSDVSPLVAEMAAWAEDVILRQCNALSAGSSGFCASPSAHAE